MSRAQGRFGRWLQRVLDADTRYICAACDDRFRCRIEGIEHVLRCHPEFGCVSLEATDVRPAVVEPVLTRAPATTATRPLVPTPLWS
ncbi:MAG: hypothetical protein IT193_03710 [Propionibacteriaceae bacterium]|nr:hypothetical protein [Propionibacteriaceae bacterium]